MFECHVIGPDISFFRYSKRGLNVKMPICNLKIQGTYQLRLSMKRVNKTGYIPTSTVRLAPSAVLQDSCLGQEYTPLTFQ